MSNNPFENNPNYTRLFRILSNADRCDSREVVELYKKKNLGDVAPYALLRYREIENQYPVKIIHKFTDMIAVELIHDAGSTILYINTIYGKDSASIVTNRFGVCCGNMTHVLNVEQNLYNVFFK